MNIFWLDPDPKMAAEYQCNKHVVKMILESAQILSTAHRILDGQLVAKKWVLPDSREPVLMGATHKSHPSVVWTASSVESYGCCSGTQSVSFKNTPTDTVKSIR